MKDNVDLVLERGSKLTDLEDRASALVDGADQFGERAMKLKNKFWWQNQKYTIGIAIIALILLIILLYVLS